MPEVDLKKTRRFKSSEQLGKWLKSNHASNDELWVQVFKKSSGKPSVNWNDIVLETLCWGWIDGVKKSHDDDSYFQRISPRKARSAWSKRNTEHVERLISERRMQEPGLEHVRAAKADGRWENAYLPPSETEVPEDFVAALKRKPKAKRFFETLTKSSKYAITYGLTTAKKPETRQRRFDKFMGMLDREEKPGFGFKDKRSK